MSWVKGVLNPVCSHLEIDVCVEITQLAIAERVMKLFLLLLLLCQDMPMAIKQGFDLRQSPTWSKLISLLPDGMEMEGAIKPVLRSESWKQ